jgi:NADH/F420H2 dehydrogenase subunit C
LSAPEPAGEPFLAALAGLGDAVESVAASAGGDLTLRVRRDAIAEVGAALKQDHGFTVLVDLCGIDFPAREPRFEVVYELLRPALAAFPALPDAAEPRRLRLKVAAGEDTPVPSVTAVWRAADGPEREAWDLFGIRFDGHPDLARILLWEGFEGHPLRKDFPVEGRAEAPFPPRDEEERGEEIELGFGPRHPAIQGVLRLKVRVDGDRIVECRPVVGHLHRGIEKLCEQNSFADNVPQTDRLDFAAAATSNLAYVGAVERLLGIAPPPRARYLRTIFAELQRIASHLLGLGTQAADLGVMPPFFAALRERDRVLGLFEVYLRQYPACSGMRPGGLSHDLPAGWVEKCQEFAGSFPARLDELAASLAENRLWKKRTVGLGVLAAEAAVDLGVTGPALRASGVAWDLRRALPYEAYGEVAFDVPVGRNGDAYDRHLVRVEEMRQAARIVVQCLDRLPDGPVLADLMPDEADSGREVYHGIEGPKGEIGFYLVGDGTANPHRCHVRAPSFANLHALPELCRGELVGDLVALIGSLDIALGEVDR